jgi:hypothetical protein
MVFCCTFRLDRVDARSRLGCASISFSLIFVICPTATSRKLAGVYTRLVPPTYPIRCKVVHTSGLKLNRTIFRGANNICTSFLRKAYNQLLRPQNVNTSSKERQLLSSPIPRYKPAQRTQKVFEVPLLLLLFLVSFLVAFSSVSPPLPPLLYPYRQHTNTPYSTMFKTTGTPQLLFRLPFPLPQPRPLPRPLSLNTHLTPHMHPSVIPRTQSSSNHKLTPLSTPNRTPPTHPLPRQPHKPHNRHFDNHNRHPECIASMGYMALDV